MPGDAAGEPRDLRWVERVREDFVAAEAADVERGRGAWDGLGYGELERGRAVCAGRRDVGREGARLYRRVRAAHLAVVAVGCWAVLCMRSSYMHWHCVRCVLGGVWAMGTGLRAHGHDSLIVAVVDVVAYICAPGSGCLRCASNWPHCGICGGTESRSLLPSGVRAQHSGKTRPCSPPPTHKYCVPAQNSTANHDLSTTSYHAS